MRSVYAPAAPGTPGSTMSRRTPPSLVVDKIGCCHLPPNQAWLQRREHGNELCPITLSEVTQAGDRDLLPARERRSACECERERTPAKSSTPSSDVGRSSFTLARSNAPRPWHSSTAVRRERQAMARQPPRLPWRSTRADAGVTHQMHDYADLFVMPTSPWKPLWHGLRAVPRSAYLRDRRRTAPPSEHHRDLEPGSQLSG